MNRNARKSVEKSFRQVQKRISDDFVREYAPLVDDAIINGTGMSDVEHNQRQAEKLELLGEK